MLNNTDFDHLIVHAESSAPYLYIKPNSAQYHPHGTRPETYPNSVNLFYLRG